MACRICPRPNGHDQALVECVRVPTRSDFLIGEGEEEVEMTAEALGERESLATTNILINRVLETIEFEGLQGGQPHFTRPTSILHHRISERRMPA